MEQRRCGICGGPDREHRVIEAIASRIAAGEPVDEVVHDYGLTIQQMGELWLEGYRRAIDGWSLLDRLPDSFGALAAAEYTLPDGWVPSIDTALSALAPYPDVERPEFWFQVSLHTKIELAHAYWLWTEEKPWAVNGDRFDTAQEAVDVIVADFEHKRAEAGR